LLLVDEFQDIAPGDLPVLQECLSHAEDGRTILTGTPKTEDNHLQAMFNQSTANEWTLTCTACDRGVVLDEHSLGPHGVICPTCQRDLDPQQGRWTPRNSEATWGEGFWVGHPMVPWLNWDAILERQRVYDAARFKNECLGLPSALGDHVVTRAELEACCGNYRMASTLADVPAAARGVLLAGIDWGGGATSRTVLVIGSMGNDFRFHIFCLQRFAGSEEPEHVLASVAERCRRFGVRFIAADGGGTGTVYNRLLLGKLQGRVHLYAVLYAAGGQEPRQDGSLWRWTVGRSSSIGALFSRVKRQMLLFPRVQDCGSFLEEFSCEIAEYDDLARTVRYTHPEAQQDDALHAANYALLLGIRRYHAQQGIA